MSEEYVPPASATPITVANGHATPEIKPTKSAAVPPSPQSDMSMRGFVKELRGIDKTSDSQSFVFLLGAGASVTSGIPGAEKLARDWLAELHEQDAAYGTVPFHQWMHDKRHGIDGLDPKNVAASYPDIFDRRFASNLNLGYAFLTSLMKDAQPGYGYSVLATMLAESRHKAVVTTNFDSLVERALLYYTNHTPLTCTHETTAGAFHKGLSRPLIVKCHRDLLLEPHNGRQETSTLHKNFGEALESLLPGRVLIAVGYGGNDRSLMTFLKSLDKKDWPEAVYWCYWEPGGPPDASIRAWVAEHKGRMVPIPGFDELMAGIAGEFEYEPLEAQMETQHKERVRRYKAQAEKIASKGLAPDRPATESTVVGPGTDETHIGSLAAAPVEHSAPGRPTNDGVNFASESIAKAVKAGKQRRTPWEALLPILAIREPNKQDEAFKAAIAEFPDDAQLLGNYANFLASIRKDADSAEAMYKRALEADPKHANNLGNYAVFLADIRKDASAAETIYKRALDIDPKNANNLGDYANFLADIRKDPDAAEAMFKRALEADPKHANNLGNYGIFLADIRKDPDTVEAIYKRALEADPQHANNLSNYAIFLASIRKDPDAAEAMYKRALVADPNRAYSLGSYAQFLANIRKNPDAAEAMYQRALAADPKRATTLGNYAYFLANIRKDHDAAEAMFKRALEADPNRASSLGNYANFLASIRKDPDAAETVYKRAVEADPKDANNLANYAVFLMDIRKDSDAADAMFKRALAVDHKDATTLGNYANFLRVDRNDPDAAEAMYKLALEADPKDAANLGNYAVFLMDIRKDSDAADAMFKRALQANPKHANNIGNYTNFLLTTFRIVEGLGMLDKAIALLDTASPTAIDAECWMYAYCCRPHKDQPVALARLKQLIVKDGVRTGEWDFAGVITQANKMGHSESAWLPKLAAVLAGSDSPACLDAWPAWASV